MKLFLAIVTVVFILPAPFIENFSFYSREVALLALCAPHGISLSGGGSQVVTHWGPKGMNGLRSGDWVMTGGKHSINKLKAGWRNSEHWADAITTTVHKSSLKWPSGWKKIKVIIGQRVYKP